MESLNDLIWSEEDENIADVTRDYLTEIVWNRFYALRGKRLI